MQKMKNKGKYAMRLAKICIFALAVSMTLGVAQYAYAEGSDGYAEVYDSADKSDDTQKAKINAYQVALNGQFILRTYVELEDEVAEATNIYMEYTINGKQQKAEPVYLSGDRNQAMFSCEVASSQIGDTIGQVLHYGSSTVAFSDYSIRAYLDMIIENENEFVECADAKVLAKALLDYGGYSQLYFDYKTNDLVNKTLTEKAVENLSDAALKSSITVKDSEGVDSADFSFMGASLVCTAKTKLCLYWRNEKHVTESDFNRNFTVDVTGSDTVEKSIKVNDDYIIITLDNISSLHYDNSFKVTISNGSVTAYRTYSVLNYIELAMETGNDKLKNLCKSMYLYHMKSEEYAETMSNDYIVFEGVKYHKIKKDNKIEGLEVIGVTVYKAQVTIPEKVQNITVTRIAARAFMNDTALTSIDLPDTVQSIGTKAFAGCTNLKSMQ